MRNDTSASLPGSEPFLLIVSTNHSHKEKAAIFLMHLLKLCAVVMRNAIQENDLNCTLLMVSSKLIHSKVAPVWGDLSQDQ